jgi:hypothetical protein
MKFIILIAIFIAAFAVSSLAQVDTLTANQIRTITAPRSIRALYVKDLNNDGADEIILCTTIDIFVYQDGNSSPIWSNSDQDNPDNLQFADFNGDSLLDIAVHNNTNIAFLDPYDSLLIYSQIITGLYKCYAVGDANRDGWPDLAIAKQEVFDASSRQDSVWITIYYGPNYTSHNQVILTIDNYYGNSDHFYQTISKMMIASVGYSSPLTPRIIVTSNINFQIFIEMFQTAISISYGNYWTINPQSLQVVDNHSSGLCDELGLTKNENTSLVYCVASFLRVESRVGSNNYTIAKYLSKFNSTGLIDSSQLYYYSGSQHHPAWTLTVGELDSTNAGPELAFGLNQTLYEHSVLSSNWLWIFTPQADSIMVKGVYIASLLFDRPQILIKAFQPSPKYLLMDGITHQVNAVLRNSIPDNSQIADVNGDGQDELLSISGSNLIIYSLARITNVAEKPSQPRDIILISNYPNPFNSKTTISFNLPDGGDVKVEIYDILGNRVDLLESNGLKAGTNQVIWDAKDKTSGIYFYRVSAGNVSKTGRMLLLK